MFNATDDGHYERLLSDAHLKAAHFYLASWLCTYRNIASSAIIFTHVKDAQKP